MCVFLLGEKLGQFVFPISGGGEATQGVELVQNGFDGFGGVTASYFVVVDVCVGFIVGGDVRDGDVCEEGGEMDTSPFYGMSVVLFVSLIAQGRVGLGVQEDLEGCGEESLGGFDCSGYGVLVFVKRGGGVLGPAEIVETPEVDDQGDSREVLVGHGTLEDVGNFPGLGT